MQTITSLAELESLRVTLGARPDWHEPAEQDITATIIGSHLDNAHCSPPSEFMLQPGNEAGIEYAIQLYQNDDPVAHINIALLLSMICQRIDSRSVPDAKMHNLYDAAGLNQVRIVLGARLDWHELDEQGITATIIGSHLDNASTGVPSPKLLDSGSAEYAVQIFQNGELAAHLNIAHLLDTATRLARVLPDETTAPVTLETTRSTPSVVSEAERRLRQALADAGAAIEDMPHDRRFVVAERFLTERGLLRDIDSALRFLIGVFVAMHQQSIERTEAVVVSPSAVVDALAKAEYERQHPSDLYLPENQPAPWGDVSESTKQIYRRTFSGRNAQFDVPAAIEAARQ